MVGNPLIADVAVQPGGIMVITAKSYGVTNVVALDRAGTTLMEHPIQVLGPNDNVIVVYRGIERETYSCMPDCERRITIGDAPTYFTATLTQADSLNAQARATAEIARAKPRFVVSGASTRPALLWSLPATIRKCLVARTAALSGDLCRRTFG